MAEKTENPLPSSTDFVYDHIVETISIIDPIFNKIADSIRNNSKDDDEYESLMCKFKYMFDQYMFQEFKVA